jgi:tagatose-1,6-bisphosphate aldolase
MTKDYEENIDTLITFGEGGYTMRKDDPRTKEAIKKNNKILEDKRKEMIANDVVSVFEGINLYSKREDGEDYGEYKQRMKLIKNLQKIYKNLGREECKLQYPQGFAYAINQAISGDLEKLKDKEGFKDKDSNPLKMVVTDQDGKILDVDIKINNDESN